MPKLTIVGRNVCGHASPFSLCAFVKTTKAEEAPAKMSVLSLGSDDLEMVLRLNAAGDISPDETFTISLDVEGLDLRTVQWAAPAPLTGRFELIALKWGDHQLLRQPGVV